MKDEKLSVINYLANSNSPCQPYNSNVVLALIINKDGKVLAVSRKNDHEDFGYPGGKVEPDENYYDALNREIFEETGLCIYNPQPICGGTDELGFSCDVYVCDYSIGGDSPYAEGYFDPILKPTTSHDTGKVQWMDWSEFLSKSKSHPFFNAEVKRVYDQWSNDMFIRSMHHSSDLSGYYRHKRSGETYQILHKTHDDWFFVKSNMTEKPFAVRKNFICDQIEKIPNVIHRYQTHLAADMKINSGNYDIVQCARAYAIDAHNSVGQEYDNNLYSKHLCDVLDVYHMFSHLIPETDQWSVQTILWCHDVIEDAMKTFNDVKAYLGSFVAEGVYAMTNEKGRNRKARANDEYYVGLLDFEYGEFTKLCDRIANVSAGSASGKMLDGYRKEQDNFRSRLKSNEIYQPMWDYLDGLLYNNIK